MSDYLDFEEGVQQPKWYKNKCLDMDDNFVKLIASMISRLNLDLCQTNAVFSDTRKASIEELSTILKEVFYEELPLRMVKNGDEYILHVEDYVVSLFLLNLPYTFFVNLIYSFDEQQIKLFSSYLFGKHNTINFTSVYDYIQPIRMVLAKGGILTDIVASTKNDEAVIVKKNGLEGNRLLGTVTGMTMAKMDGEVYDVKTKSGTYCTDFFVCLSEGE
jgi:hypothetical protein